MRIFWMVYENEFSDFITYIIKKYNRFDNSFLDYESNYRVLMGFRCYYKLNNNIYLCISHYECDDYYHLSYCHCSDYNYDFLMNNSWQYMGEYYGRKEKLKRLNIISNNS